MRSFESLAFSGLIVPTLIGGLVLALSIRALRRQAKDQVAADASSRHLRLTDVINMARIEVSGVGGLGLVAMAIVVAIAIPSILRSTLTGLVLGVLFAAVLIYRRRQTGPLPSSGQRPGAHTMLVSDDDPVKPGARNGTGTDATLLAGAGA